MQNLITGVAHLGLQVSDINKSSQFYQSLGFKLNESFTKPFEHGEVSVQFLTSPALTIELYQLPTTVHSHQVYSGIEHIALEVSDIEKALQTITALGYPINEGPVYQKRETCEVHFFLISGPDGERVEFDMTHYF